MPIPIDSTTREELKLTTVIIHLFKICAKHPWIEGIFKQYMFMTLLHQVGKVICPSWATWSMNPVVYTNYFVTL